MEFLPDFGIVARNRRDHDEKTAPEPQPGFQGESGARSSSQRRQARRSGCCPKPVEAKGPDILTNDIAPIGHGPFDADEGLVNLSDDLDILVSRQANDPDSIRSPINGTGRAIARSFERPHPQFLEWRRESGSTEAYSCADQYRGSLPFQAETAL